MGSTINKVSQAKKDTKTLGNQMNQFATNIANTSNYLKQMMNGDSQNAYWDGKAAHEWYDNCIVYLSKMCGNYANSYKVYEKLAKEVDKADGKRISKKKAFLARYDGTIYTKNVSNKDLNSLKLSGVPATVHDDSSSDCNTKTAYKCYINLKQSLMELANYTNNMNKTWESIKSYTKGDLHKKSGGRITALDKREKEIKNVANKLEEEFIGDVLFK